MSKFKGKRKATAQLKNSFTDKYGRPLPNHFQIKTQTIDLHRKVNVFDIRIFRQDIFDVDRGRSARRSTNLCANRTSAGKSIIGPCAVTKPEAV